jgi:hypothetical protein
VAEAGSSKPWGTLQARCLGDMELSIAEEPPVVQMGKTGRDYPDRDPQLFYELAKERLAAQLEFVDAVDNKLGILVSIASALMGILVAVVAVRESGSAATGVTTADWCVIGLSIAAYLLVGGMTLRAYRSREWDLGPDLDQVWDDYWDPKLEDDLVKWNVAEAFWRFYRENKKAQEIKAEYLPRVLALVILQTLTLVAALGLVSSGG